MGLGGLESISACVCMMRIACACFIVGWVLFVVRDTAVWSGSVSHVAVVCVHHSHLSKQLNSTSQKSLLLTAMQMLIVPERGRCHLCCSTSLWPLPPTNYRTVQHEHTQTHRQNSVHVTASRTITVQDTCNGPSVTVLNIHRHHPATKPDIKFSAATVVVATCRQEAYSSSTAPHATVLGFLSLLRLQDDVTTICLLHALTAQQLQLPCSAGKL